MIPLKKSFLLSQAIQISQKNIFKSFYDDQTDINISFYRGDKIPTVILNGSLSTQSKTANAPGDDDPDREAELCY